MTRDERQELSVKRFIDAGGKATVEAATGYGKTRVAILLIQKYNNNRPNAVIDVVVPTLNLKDDWEKEDGHINKFNLKGVRVYVINTYISASLRVCDFLILDEIHNTGAESFFKVFNICTAKFCLGLTATMKRQDERHLLIQQYCPICDIIPLEECRANGWVSNFIVYNLGIELNPQEREEYDKMHKMFNNLFGTFEYNFELMMACGAKAVDSKGNFKRVKLKLIKTEHGIELFKKSKSGIVTEEYKTPAQWREWWLRRLGDNAFVQTQKDLEVRAYQAMHYQRARKEFLYKLPARAEACKDVFNLFRCSTIIFNERQEMAELVEQEIGECCRSFHGKIKGGRVKVLDGLFETEIKLSAVNMKKYILKEFENKNLLALSAVRALDEGLDVQGIELVINGSYNSTERQDTQRTGRGVRKDYANEHKLARIVNIYVKDTQEENWLRNKQVGKRNIMWASSISEIL